MLPKISIIIPVYNTQNYIRRCLESCIHQTLKEIQIILIDDCGSDDSMSIAKEYAKKDSRIEIISHEKNLGSFQARKTGLKIAKAKYCMFCDSDDFLDLKALEFSLELAKAKQAQIINLKIKHFPKTLKRVSPHFVTGKLLGEQILQALAKNRDAITLCAKLFETSLLIEAYQALDFVDRKLSYGEDILVFLVICFYAKSYYGERKTIYYYCDNTDSVTRQNPKDSFEKKYASLSYILETLQTLKLKFPQYQIYINQFEQKIASTIILDTRFSDSAQLIAACEFIKKYHFRKNFFGFNVYTQSVWLSLCYHFRWQNLIRLIINIISFGKIKI